MTASAPAARHSARAILLDGQGRLLLIKRTRPGQPPYWTAPGGGIEESDSSVEAALHRELAEELGAHMAGAAPVFLVSSPGQPGQADGSVQHFFVGALAGLNASPPTGEEYADPARGGYELDRVELHADALTGIDLRPPALKEFVLANRAMLLAAAAITPTTRLG